MKGLKDVNTFVIIDPNSPARSLVTHGFSVGDYLGKGLTVFSLWQGYKEDCNNHMTVGEDISHNGFIYLVGNIISSISIYTFDNVAKDFLKGHVGWRTIIKDIAIGGTTGFLNSTLGETAYDNNTFGIRDFVDSTSFIGDSIDMTKRAIYQSWKEIQPHWFEWYRESEVEKMKNYGQALTLR